MDYSWVILAALGGISSNINSFLNRYILVGKEDSTAFGWFYEFLRLLLFLPLVLIGGFTTLSFNSLMLLLMLGLIEFVSMFIWMKMFAYTHLSISAVIYRTRLIWIPIMAFVFLHEVLKVKDYIGIVVLFLGLSIAVSPHRLFIDKGIKYSYLSAFLAALVTVNMKLVASTASIPVLSVFMSLPSIILFPLFMKNSRERIRQVFKTRFYLKVAAVFANMAAVYFLFLALRVGPVSTVNGIYQSMMVISIFMGITILGEKKDIGKKILGTAVVLVGIILLTAL